MCQHCNLELLDQESFDSFFDEAREQGLRSMVCRHCSTTFLTELALVGSSGPGQGHPSAPESPAVERWSCSAR